MKEFVELLKKDYSEKLESLQRTANLVVNGEKEQEYFNKFVELEIAKIVEKDNKLFEKFFDAAYAAVRKELGIKPDSNYVRSGADDLILGIVKILFRNEPKGE